MSHTVGHINHWHALLFSLVLLLGMDLSCSSILVFRWSWTAPHASLKMAGGGKVQTGSYSKTWIGLSTLWRALLSTKRKKELIRNCFWRIKFQGCVLAYSGLKLRSEYTKIVWVGRSHTHTHTHTLTHTRTLIEQTKQNNQKFKEHQQALYC